MKITLIILMILTSLIAQSQVSKTGKDLYLISENRDSDPRNCGVDIKFNPAIHENLTAPVDISSVSFIWPFDVVLDDGLILVNYVDHFSNSSIKDYNDYEWTYDNHAGTDICVHDFRNMDRFYSVKAAAAGTVVEISVNNFDRNVALGNGLPANYVLIHHSDGTYAYYYHLMKKSITVKLGEYVLQGQNIGYVGSSGNSTDPHLHFEPGSFVNGDWVRRDPWQGTYNHQASLWQSQYAYVGTRAFTLHDMGVYTKSLVGGNMSNTMDYVKERIITPNTIGGYEDTLGFWAHVQAVYTGQQIRFELRRPDGSLYDYTYTYANDYLRNAYYYWTPYFNQGTSNTGDWYVRVLFNNVEKGRYFFNVQLLTSNRPRMYPAAAKCFRNSLFVQRDTLRVRPVRSNMQYDLLNAPPGVTITQDSIVNIGAVSQTFRVREFKVIASIGGSATLRDTMIYKHIDTTKNNSSGNGIQSLELNAKIEGLWNGTTMVNDTVTVILRAPLFPFNVADSDRVVLNSAGYALANFFNISPGIYYYIVVKHRNSIETWSKTTQSFSDGYPIAYDFTTSSTKAYGNNMKYKSGDYCFYSGDVNQDGIIDGSDVSNIDNDLSFTYAGYVATDIDGDEFVDSADLAIVDNNTYAGVVKIRP